LGAAGSRLHGPVDAEGETDLGGELVGWLPFAGQKHDELTLLGRALADAGQPAVRDALAIQRAALQARRQSPRIHNPAVGRRMAEAASVSRERAPFAERIAQQQKLLNLPAFPTTTIGSFPPTAEIRAL